MEVSKEELLSAVGGVEAVVMNPDLAPDSGTLTAERSDASWGPAAPAATTTQAEPDEASQEGEEPEWDQEAEGTEVLDDPVRMYLREIGRVHLLTSRDERVLARKMGAAVI